MANESLEPKVAKLELAVDTVTKDLASLTAIVRELAQGVQKQWQETETQFSKLLVLVERASAPRKTDWHLVIGSVGLVLAIGAAAFSPMLMRSNDVQGQVNKMQAEFALHERLKLHPVGEEKINALEDNLKERSLRNAADLAALDLKLQKEYQLTETALRDKSLYLEQTLKEKDSKLDQAIRDLDNKLQREFSQLNEASERRVTDMLKQFQDTIPAMRERLGVLEALRTETMRTGQPAQSPTVAR